MRIENLGMLIASSPRAKAYVQLLIRNKLFPSHVIIMDDGSGRLGPGQLADDHAIARRDSDTKASQVADSGVVEKYFDPHEPVVETLERAAISYSICPSTDVNSDTVIKTVLNRPERYFIYSGIGGVILRDGILNTGKRFLHVHPGRVPDFRGSTTLYYSILEEDRCGASAFFFDRNIDTGDLIMIKEYSRPDDGTLIDYIYDPYVRADLLIEAVRRYADTGSFGEKKQESHDGETYYIIHPVLKHIAILSCGANE